MEQYLPTTVSAPSGYRLERSDTCAHRHRLKVSGVRYMLFETAIRGKKVTVEFTPLGASTRATVAVGSGYIHSAKCYHILVSCELSNDARVRGSGCLATEESHYGSFNIQHLDLSSSGENITVVIRITYEKYVK